MKECLRFNGLFPSEHRGRYGLGYLTRTLSCPNEAVSQSDPMIRVQYFAGIDDRLVVMQGKSGDLP
jgi:hypothetical protein